MQKAHLYEAILLVNRGVDETLHGLERLQRIKGSQLDSACFDEELVLLEEYRARLNSHFCSVLQRAEEQDSIRFEARYCEYEKKTFDEVQVCRDLRMVEDRRRAEGKSPKVRFFRHEEQWGWEPLYPKPPCDSESAPQHSRGDQP
jgi:hypothetical protein